jgi:hypothetical protein
MDFVKHAGCVETVFRYRVTDVVAVQVNCPSLLLAIPVGNGGAVVVNRGLQHLTRARFV